MIYSENVECLAGLFVSNGGLHGLPGSIHGLPSGFNGIPHGLNGSLAPSPTSREDTPHSLSPKPSSDMVRIPLNDSYL